MHERRTEGGRAPEVAVALDFPRGEEALAMVDRLGEGADLFKVGLELFTRSGPGIVERLRERGKRIFLDLKLHDIPTTVKGAVRAAAELEVELLTVHAAGGPAMVRAARDAAEAARMRILAVTVLTSLGPRDLAMIQGRHDVPLDREVLRLAVLAWEAGAHGVVASPGEVRILRDGLGERPLLVTPGIRLPGDDAHDQARVATPGAAVASGADVLVVGRSVTGARDPRAALERVRSGMMAGSRTEGAGAGVPTWNEPDVEEA